MPKRLTACYCHVPPAPYKHVCNLVLTCLNVCTQEGSGFVAVQTSSYIVYGSYSSSMFPSVCVEAVEKLGNLAIV